MGKIQSDTEDTYVCTEKIGKAIGILLLVLLILLILVLAGAWIYHRVRLNSSREFLAEQGFYNPASAGDHDLNLVRYGGADEKHRIIALGGSGGGFPLELKEMAEMLREDGAVYYLARPGFDGSDDVKDEMTVSFVVEEYRKALQSTGVTAPYVLMPHSYAGLLATYWVSKYPDEIEAVVNLDGTIPMYLTAEQKQEAVAEAEDGTGILRTMIQFGVLDIATRSFIPEDEACSADEQRMSDAMTIMTMGSKAFSSEMLHFVDNMEETMELMRTTDVPKLYINAKRDMMYGSAEEMKADDTLSESKIAELTENFSGTEEERRDRAYELEWAEHEKYMQETWNPYFEKIGNCEIVNLPGDHFIHAEQPQACADVIRDFLGRLG